eukprot:evm.model.scf_1049EXC.5 EVM.evm.TU.scf_1049EXC.5   scf_1049EXC:31122-36641(-)
MAGTAICDFRIMCPCPQFHTTFGRCGVVLEICRFCNGNFAALQGHIILVQALPCGMKNLSVRLLVCNLLLLFFVAKLVTAQENQPPTNFNCSLLGNGDTFSGASTVVTEDVLDAADNNLQFVVDCISSNGSIVFDTPSVEPISTITIDKPVRMEASDAIGKTVFSCPPGGTIFDIRSHGVSLANLVFANCSTDGAAAVQAEDCGPGPNQVDIVGVEFLSNANTNATAGLKVSSCRVRARGVKFIDGTGTEGGAVAISNNSIVVLEDSSFENNMASFRGGALHVRSSAVSVASCNFTGNNASMDGGAIYAEDGTNLTLVGCRLDSNAAGFRGGGLHAQSASTSNISVIGTAFLNNSVDGSAVDLGQASLALFPVSANLDISQLPAGGGMAINGTGIRCTIENGALFEGNNVSGIGGAISIDGVGDFLVNKTDFRANVGWHGSNVYMVSSVSRLSRAAFLDSRGDSLAGDNPAENDIVEGTSIWAVNSRVDVDNSRFRNNTANQGSAIHAASSNISLQHCSFEENVDKVTGCITLINATVVNATSCIFSNNAAIGSTVGGVKLNSLGGVAIAVQGSRFAAASCIFQNNSAFVGGAAAMLTGSAVFDNCTFLQNTATFSGGAIYASEGSGFTSVNCTFDGNAAGLLGGAVSAETPFFDDQAAVATVSGSTFKRNRAGFSDRPDSLTGSGGAMFCGDFSRFNVDEDNLEGEQIQNVGGVDVLAGNLQCTFEGTEFTSNAAGLGGAVSGVFANNISMDFVAFIENSAVDGGALYFKMGGSSDPQELRFPGTYVSGGNVSFVSNVARRGGAMFSVTDVSTADLVRSSISHDNVTRTTSDGMNGNEDDVFMMDSTFRRNVANDSGGVWYSERTRMGCRNCTFAQNSANSSGGAILIMERSVLHARNVTFAENSAKIGGALSARDSFVDIMLALVDNNVAEMEGGGLHISTLDSIPYGFKLISHVGNATVVGNRAPVGAGLYFVVENDPRSTRIPDVERMAVTASNFSDNSAALAGAALFTNRPDVLDVCCACDLNKTRFPQGEGFEVLRLGVENISAISPTGLLDTPRPCPQSWSNNTVPKEVDSDVVGTTARSTELCTEDGACARDGAPLKILNHVSGEELENITVRLLDSFNHTAFGQPDVQVRVEPAAPGILTSGQLIAFLGAVTNLTSIRLQAEVGQTHVLRLSFITGNLPGRDIEVEVRSCVPGETPFRNETCSVCESGLYSFDPGMPCARCPDNAECQGSTVTPRDGFWHSTSKSVELHECINEESCSTNEGTMERGGGKSRGDLLAERAMVAHSNGSLLEFSSDEDYPQCAPGYHGVLCGACDDTHGKVRSGECVECRGRARNAIFASIVALWLFIVVSVLAKNVLTVVSDEEIAGLTGGAQQGVPATKRRKTCLPRESTDPPDASSSAAASAQLSGSIAFLVQGASPPYAEESRSVQVHHEESLVAEILRNRNYSSDILKITVNFLQVTGVAVFINAGWTRSVARTLGVADAAASGGQGLFAFECAFSNMSSIPRSTQMSIVSLLFPLMLQVVLMTLLSVFTIAKSRSLAFLFRRWHVCALVIFYFVYIEMARNMVIIFDCVKVDEGDQPEGYAVAGSRYWVRDTDTICRQGGHLTLTLALAVPVLVVVTFGFPFGLLLIFSAGDRGKFETPAFLGTYGFLYWSYRPGSRYWEVVIMLRKVCLAAISVFDFSLRANLQATLAVGVLVIAAIAHLWAQPFVTVGPNLHRMEAVSLSCSILAYLTALIFNDPNTSDAGKIIVSVVLIVSVLGVLLYLLVELVREAWKVVDKILLRAHIKVEEDTTALTKVRLLAALCWRLLTGHTSDKASQVESINGLPA